MSDRHLHSNQKHLKKLTSGDPIGVELYLRAMRYAYIKAAARKLLLFPRRFIKQRFDASSQSTAGARVPLTSAAKALIANLMAMR